METHIKKKTLAWIMKKWLNKGRGVVFSTFPKIIRLKVNKIVRFIIKFVYFKAAVQHFSH